MSYAIYVRQSLDRTGEGLAISRQLAECRKLVRQRDLIGEERVFRDNDVSASSRAPRPEWQKLLEEIEAGRVTTVVAWHTDRLYRRTRDTLSLIEAGEPHNLRVLTVKAGDMDLATPAGKMIATQLVAVAQYEVEQKSARQTLALAQKRSAGQRTSGFRSFGYDGDKVVQREARAIRTACTRILRGESTTSIWKAWNERGLLTPRGNRWDGTTFRNMMKRPALCGRVSHKGVVLPDVRGTWKPILDEATWEAVQSVLTDPARRTSPGPEPRHLASGVTYCECGRTMRSATNTTKSKRTGESRRFYVYKCSSNQPGHSSIKKTILDDVVERSVVDALYRRMQAPPQGVPNDAELRDLLSRRAKLDEEEDRLITMIMAKPSPRAEAMRAKLLLDRASLEQRIAEQQRALIAASAEDEWMATTWAENAGKPFVAEEYDNGTALLNIPALFVSFLEDTYGFSREEAIAKAELHARFEALEHEEGIAAVRALVRSTVRVTVHRARERGDSRGRVAVEYK